MPDRGGGVSHGIPPTPPPTMATAPQILIRFFAGASHPAACALVWWMGSGVMRCGVCCYDCGRSCALYASVSVGATEGRVLSCFFLFFFLISFRTAVSHTILIVILSSEFFRANISRRRHTALSAI